MANDLKAHTENCFVMSGVVFSPYTDENPTKMSHKILKCLMLPGFQKQEHCQRKPILN